MFSENCFLTFDLSIKNIKCTTTVVDTQKQYILKIVNLESKKSKNHSVYGFKITRAKTRDTTMTTVDVGLGRFP